jgi:hypothetical protein
MLPFELKPEWVTIERDNREQLGWTVEELAPLPVVDGTRQTGDYGLLADPSLVSIERKSLPDLLCVCTGERPRFEKELERLRGFPVKFLICETSWEEIERAEWRSRANANVVIGSILSWQCSGLPVILAGNRARAAKLAARILYLAAKHRWQDARRFAAAIIDVPVAEMEIAQ